MMKNEAGIALATTPLVPVVAASGADLSLISRAKANKLVAKGKGAEEVGPDGSPRLRLFYDPVPVAPTVAENLGKSARWRRNAIAGLRERDGDECFYCLRTMWVEEMTIEHLLAAKFTKTTSRANLALAHEACNQVAGHASVMEKIRLRETALLAREAERVRSQLLGNCGWRCRHCGEHVPRKLEHESFCPRCGGGGGCWKRSRRRLRQVLTRCAEVGASRMPKTSLRTGRG